MTALVSTLCSNLADDEADVSSKRNAKSLDDISEFYALEFMILFHAILMEMFCKVVDDEIEFIDESDSSSDRQPTRQSSMREKSGRQRVPPTRTKSMPGSALYVVYGGKKLMYDG